MTGGPRLAVRENTSFCFFKEIFQTLFKLNLNNFSLHKFTLHKLKCHSMNASKKMFSKPILKFIFPKKFYFSYIIVLTKKNLNPIHLF